MRLKFVIIFLIIMLLPSASAVEIEMKDSFSQGETFIAKISGNFFESPTEDKIVFHREHVRVPINPSLAKINDDFYVYAQLFGKEEGNYSITLKDAKYYEVNQIVEADIKSNFTITGNFSDFFIEPGVVIAENDFSLEIQNLRNTEITVYAEIAEESDEDTGFFESLFGGDNLESNSLSSLTLKSGEKKNFDFEISDFNEGLNILELTSENTLINVPVYNAEKTEVGSSDSGINFEKREFNISLSVNSSTSRILNLINSGNETVENIAISVSDSLKPYAEISEINFDLEKNSSRQIEVVFVSDNEEKTIEGEISAVSEDSASVSISLNFIKGRIGKIVSCSELGGNLCGEGKECRGDSESASDGNCCIGICEESVERSYTGVIVGWILIIAVALYVVWFYLKKYKKVGKVTNLLRIARKK